MKLLTKKDMNIEHKILHQKFLKYGANAKEWMRKCALLLPEIEKYEIWKQKGFDSIYEYAAKLAGMGKSTVYDTLRIMEKIADKPELQKVVALKGINAVRPVVAIATVETAGFWAEKAMTMSKNTLEVYVKEMKKQEIFCTSTKNNAKNTYQQAISLFENDDMNGEVNNEVNNDLSNCLNTDINNDVSCNAGIQAKKTIVMQLEPEIADQLEKLKGEGDWNTLIKELLEARNHQFEEQKPQAVNTESRHIPAKIRRYVLARTGGQCAYPGCKKPYQILHHTQRFALDKIHDPDRLHGLCKAHERLAHHGLIENENHLPRDWYVRAQADPSEPKYIIDNFVAKYRSFVGI